MHLFFIFVWIFFLLLVLHILFSANVKPLFESSVSCWFLCRSNVLFGQMIFKDECWTQLRFIVCCCFFTSGDFVLLVFFGGRSIFVCFCGVFCFFLILLSVLLLIFFFFFLNLIIYTFLFIFNLNPL